MSGWNERRPIPAQRVIVREPEAAWWEAQRAWDASVRHPAVTVAVVGQSDAGRDPGAVVRRLAELAVDDELLVVYVAEPPSRPGHRAVLDGLRDHLPRHDVVAMHLPRHDRADRRDAAAMLGRFLDEGSLPVVVTVPPAMRDLTAEISSYLRADRVLRVFRTTAGAELCQVWSRRETASLN